MLKQFSNSYSPVQIFRLLHEYREDTKTVKYWDRNLNFGNTLPILLFWRDEEWYWW